MELDELFEIKRDLEDRISTFFDGDDDGDIHYGDRNYQSLVERLVEVQERIDEIIESQNI